MRQKTTLAARYYFILQTAFPKQFFPKLEILLEHFTFFKFLHLENALLATFVTLYVVPLHVTLLGIVQDVAFELLFLNPVQVTAFLLVTLYFKPPQLNVVPTQLAEAVVQLFVAAETCVVCTFPAKTKPAIATITKPFFN